MPNLKIYDDSKNYTCQVVKLSSLRKHNNADKLMIAIVQGNSVICGLDTDVAATYLYFPLESQISTPFATGNDLIRRKDEEGKNVGGMFEEKRRVKCLKLRGEKSEGFICPINFLDVIGIDSSNLKVGDEFNAIDGINICQKYVIRTYEKGERKDRKSVKRISRLVPDQVRLHNDTEQLRKNIFKLDLEDYVSIHYKKHGTSWWAGNLLVKRKLSWIERILDKLGVNIRKEEYDYVYGSRKVVKNEYETQNSQHYFGYDFWAEIKEEVKEFIPKGYTLYGEAVGYTKEGSAIQGKYDYGCKLGEHKTYIYRITITNVDGKVIDLDDLQIKEFCNKYGLLYEDTFIWYGEVETLFRSLTSNPYQPIENDWRDILLNILIDIYNDKDCYMCVNKVPEEGIVLRRASLYDYEAYKLKSFRFLEQETKDLDKGMIDMESEQSLEIIEEHA